MRDLVTHHTHLVSVVHACMYMHRWRGNLVLVFMFVYDKVVEHHAFVRAVARN